MTHNISYSDDWESTDWKKLQKVLFRLQRRIFKAIREGDKARAKRLQKLVLSSYAARMLAIRQVSQLNTGKKTAGIDGVKSLNFKQRFDLETTLRKNYKTWQHQGLREIPIPKKDGSQRLLKVPTIADRAWQCLLKYALEPAHEATFHARSYGFRPGRSTHDAHKKLFHNYWSKRNSVLYDGATAKTLRKQNHSCGHCGLKFLDGEKVEVHHLDGNHGNWDNKNLLAIHRSCHHYVHMGNSRKD